MWPLATTQPSGARIRRSTIKRLEERLVSYALIRWGWFISRAFPVCGDLPAAASRYTLDTDGHRAGCMRQRNQDVYTSAPMHRLLEEQLRVLMPDLQRCFGSHALLLGASPDDGPPALPLVGCWTSLHLRNNRYRGDLQAAADEPLPFVDDAFELVLLRHALEVAPVASALLDDAIRMLAPGGVLVVTGIHPLSGWAPWLRWRGHGASQMPRLQLPLRLRHGLLQAGLEIERAQRVGRMLPGLPMIPTQGGVLGGGYILFARKQRRAITPLRFRPAPARVPANGRWSPSIRRSSAS